MLLLGESRGLKPLEWILRGLNPTPPSGESNGPGSGKFGHFGEQVREVPTLNAASLTLI